MGSAATPVRIVAATWLIADSGDIVVADGSVAMTGIDRSAVPEVLGKGAPDPAPARLLGRLAVDHRCERLGFQPFAPRRI